MAEFGDLVSSWFDPQLLGQLVVAWSGRLLAAVAILFVGRLLLRGLKRWSSAAMTRVGLDATLIRFFANVLYAVPLVFLVLTALSALGVPTTNFLAIAGAAGLAVGLALKDSLSYFSSGVMLRFFRPFKVGDLIDAAGVSGIVESIGMFDVVLKTPDNRVITVPSSLIYGSTITNYNAEATRRIDLKIAIGYHADIPQAQSVIGDYGAVRSELLERIKRAPDKYGLSIPAEQRALPAVSLTALK